MSFKSSLFECCIQNVGKCQFSSVLLRIWLEKLLTCRNCLTGMVVSVSHDQST